MNKFFKFCFLLSAITFGFASSALSDPLIFAPPPHPSYAEFPAGSRILFAYESKCKGEPHKVKWGYDESYTGGMTVIENPGAMQMDTRVINDPGSYQFRVLSDCGEAKVQFKVR